jgi:integrase
VAEDLPRHECPAGEIGLVLPNGKGNPESYGNIMRRVFYPLQVKAGITDRDGQPKFGFHALRHACASLMIEQGWPVKKLQAILGHSSISMTMDVYGHLFTKAEDDVALFDKMEQDLMAAQAKQVRSLMWRRILEVHGVRA